MAPKQPRRKHDYFRKVFGFFRKPKFSRKKAVCNDAVVDRAHVVSPAPRLSTTVADDVGQCNEDNTLHVDSAHASQEHHDPSNDDGQSACNQQPSVAHSGARVDAAQPSAAASIPFSDVGQATPSREEGTSAAQSGSNVDPTPAVAEGSGTAGDATEEVASSRRGKGKFAPYLSAAAWIALAGSMSQVSDAIPPLKPTISVLKVILENVSTMEENKDAVGDLCSRIKRLLELLVHDKRVDPSMFHVVALTKSFTKINQELGQIGGPTEGHLTLSVRSKQFVFASGNKSRIDRFIASVDRALLDYQIAVMHKLYVIKLDEMDKDDEDTLNTMCPVSEAMFDASDSRVPCLPGTRVEILHKLEGWATDATARQLYWLNGHAGSGKSTIAQSLAERLFVEERLGASFFCSRNSQKTADLKSIFTTIAFQLARAMNKRSAAYRKSLVKTIRRQSNPNVTTYSLSEQLKQLILEPAAESGIDSIVIIDALDECVDDKSTSAILDLLSQHAARLPHLKIKFFITSRPESHIRSGFRLRPLKELTDVMVIHEVAADSIDQDIRLFLDHNFVRIATSRSDINLSESVWPKPEEIDTLVIASAGLFIFASTIIKYLDNARGDPKIRLREVFDFENTRTHIPQTSSARYPFGELDKLYSTILNEAQPDSPQELREILGLIVLAYTPVSIATIAEILGLSDGDVRTHLRPLHSVLLVPSKPMDTLRIHHKSFADFLVDPHRCSDSQLLIIAGDHHRSIALHCLDFMKGGLKKNICSLPRYSMNSDLAPAKLDECVGIALRYCCQYWAKHITSDRGRDQTFRETHFKLEYLIMKQMLMWVEVLSLIGELPSAVHSLVMLKEWLTTLQASDVARTLLDWILDGHRLVLLGFDIISLSVSHIYHSALVFAPEQSLLKRAHAADLTAEARLLIGATTEWEGPLRTMGTKYTPIALEFSHDGSMLAIGGAQKDCCIVHLSTGAQMFSELFKAELEKLRLQPTSWVTSVSFSADNRILAMSCHDIVLLLDVHTGLTSAQHLDTAYNKLMVVFCPSSHYAPLLLVSLQEGTSGNLQLYLWDTSSGTPSEGRKNCDRLSLDRVSAWCWLHGDQAIPHIAVGLGDGAIEIRGLAPSQSPSLLARFNPALFTSPIVSVTSSRDGTKIAALSADGELSLFTTQTHQSGTLQLTHILSFPKELRLPSTDERRTLWKLYFMQESHTLVIKEPGHGKLRAFRLDCSASQAGVEEITLSDSELHRSYTIAFSPDGQYIAYGRKIDSLSAAIPSLLQHHWHKNSLRTLAVGAPKPESHCPTSIRYCDGQMVITKNYIWDVIKHERRYSCGDEVGEMSDAFRIKDDLILSCNQHGDVTLWDPSREQPVIERWEGRINGREPKLHVFAVTASTIRFLSYSRDNSSEGSMEIVFWAITSTDTLAPPIGSTASDESGPHLHHIAAGQIPANHNITSVYHEYLADLNREQAVFYLEMGKIYLHRDRGFHKWSAAQATNSEPIVEEDSSGPDHIVFEEVPSVWEDESAGYPIAGDGLFRMSEDRRWVLDSRRRKRLWLPPAYTSAVTGSSWEPAELYCAHRSTWALGTVRTLSTLIDFSSANFDHSVPF